MEAANTFSSSETNAQAVVTPAPSAQPPSIPSKENIRELVRAVQRSGGARVNEPDTRGVPLLHRSAAEGDTELIRVLLQLGADASAQDRAGQTALHWAAINGQARAVEVLAEAGAALETQECEAGSPLHVAAGNGHVEVIQTLARLGANMSVRNPFGQTAMRTAAVGGHLPAMCQLAAHGCAWSDLQADTTEQARPLDLYVKLHSGARGIPSRELYKEAEGLLKQALRAGPGYLAPDPAARDRDRARPRGSRASKGGKSRARRGGAARLSAPVQGSRGDLSLCRELERAAELDNVEAIEELVAAGVDVNATSDTWGMTALGRAAGSNAIRALRALVQHGAEVTAVDAEGVTALHWAAGNGCVDAVKALVECGADANQIDKKGLSVLDRAAGKGQVEVVTLLAHLGAAVNAIDGVGVPAIYWAADNRHFSTLRALVSLGADIDMRAQVSGNTVLHQAAGADDQELIELLLELGVDPAVRDAKGLAALDWAAQCGAGRALQLFQDKAMISAAAATAALLWAAAQGDLRCCSILLDAGADCVARDSHGWSALHLCAAAHGSGPASTAGGDAAQDDPNAGPKGAPGQPQAEEEPPRGAPDTVALLVNKGGADVNLQAHDTRLQDPITPLQVAVEQNNVANVRALVRLGADLTVQKRGGAQESLLHCAAERGHVAVIRELVALGADPSSRNAQGIAAIHSAALSGHSRAIRCLLELDPCSATLKGPTPHCMTALHFAAGSGHRAAVEELVQGGKADPGQTDAYGHTGMHLAAMAGHLELMLVLAAQGLRWTDPLPPMGEDHHSPSYFLHKGQASLGQCDALDVYMRAHGCRQRSLLEGRLRRAAKDSAGRKRTSHSDPAPAQHAASTPHTPRDGNTSTSQEVEGSASSVSRRKNGTPRDGGGGEGAGVDATSSSRGPGGTPRQDGDAEQRGQAPREQSESREATSRASAQAASDVSERHSSGGSCESHGSADAHPSGDESTGYNMDDASVREGRAQPSRRLVESRDASVSMQDGLGEGRAEREADRAQHADGALEHAIRSRDLEQLVKALADWATHATPAKLAECRLLRDKWRKKMREMRRKAHKGDAERVTRGITDGQQASNVGKTASGVDVAGGLESSAHSISTPSQPELCVVCMDAVKDCCFSPCGHKCVCATCAHRIVTANRTDTDAKCPVCRSHTTAWLKVFDV